MDNNSTNINKTKETLNSDGQSVKSGQSILKCTKFFSFISIYMMKA